MDNPEHVTVHKLDFVIQHNEIARRREAAVLICIRCAKRIRGIRLQRRRRWAFSDWTIRRDAILPEQIFTLGQSLPKIMALRLPSTGWRRRGRGTGDVGLGSGDEIQSV